MGLLRWVDTLRRDVLPQCQVLSFLVWTGCYGFFHTNHSNRFDPRILLGMPSLPEGFQLVLPGLQFELGASREDPYPNSCLRIIPVPSNRPVLKSNPKSLILISGPLTSYCFYRSLGWPSSEVTSFSWNSLLGPYLHSTCIC